MRFLTRTAILVLAVSLSAPLEAGFRKFRANRPQRMVMGDEAVQKETNLLALNWTTNLGDALKQAAAQDRLVFWVHMLGKINGST